MSDTFLYLIPADPLFKPSRDAATKTSAVLKEIVGGIDVTVEFSDSVSFFNPVGNWLGVECPVCGADVESWWLEVMDAAYSEGFKSLERSTQCCGSSVSLNDLRYLWPAGFAKFALKVSNPNVIEIRPDDLQRLSGFLGAKLKQVWSRI